MLLTSSSGSSVLDTENGDVYIWRTARDYPIPPLAWHETHRNSSTIVWDMQWWCYGREKNAFVGTTVQSFCRRKLVNTSRPMRRSVMLKEHSCSFLGRFSRNSGRNFVTHLHKSHCCILGNSMSISPSVSQNMFTIIFSALPVTRNVFGGGESVCFHWADCHLVSGLNIGIQVSPIVTIDEKKALSYSCHVITLSDTLRHVKPCFHQSAFAEPISQKLSAISGRHARWCPQIQRICVHWQLSVSQSSGGFPQPFVPLAQSCLHIG